MTNILDTTKLFTGKLAQKTKGLKAKPATALYDKSVLHATYISTPEGLSKVDPLNLICIGVAGELWQQRGTDLYKKYNFNIVDADGWLHFDPKPEVTVEFFQAEDTHGFIVGRWGQTVDGIENLQYFGRGDFIVRRPGDPSDQWVVKKSIWDRSYTEVL